MDGLIHNFEEYVRELFGISAKLTKWDGEKDLPYFLRDAYSFYQTLLLDVPCLLMVEAGETERTPTTIHKHIATLQGKCEGVIIYVSGSISAHNRKRLLDCRVPFVVPGNQMLVPQLGIALRERLRRNRKTVANAHLSPSTQVVILQAILRNTTESYTPSVLADLLGYTRMTLTRALDEIEKAGVGEVVAKGKERILTFTGSKYELWKNTQGLMRNPVKRRLWIPQSICQQHGIQSGLTALSHYSMLAPPAQPTYAIGTQDWAAIQLPGDFAEISADDPETCALEIWHYSPGLFAEDKQVDRLSLYLSLRGTEDERVQAALEEMMEALPW